MCYGTVLTLDMDWSPDNRFPPVELFGQFLQGGHTVPIRVRALTLSWPFEGTLLHFTLAVW